MSTPSRMNPEGMCQSAMERWMGGWERRTHLRKHFALIGLLGGAFLTRTMQWEDAEGYPEGAIWLAIYGCAAYSSAERLVWPLQHQLARLREAHRDLPGFVYYGLVDTLRLVVNVYDWRDAQAEYELHRRTFAGAVGIARDGGDLGAEPKDVVPAWLGTRSRVSAARAVELACASSDPWVRKTVEAVAVLREAAEKLDRKRLLDFPFAAFGEQYAGALDADEYMAPATAAQRGGPPRPQGEWPRDPDGPPVLLFTMKPHDEVEGYAREALRHTEMFEYGMRTVRRQSDTILPVVPVVSIGMNYLDPPSLHRGVKLFGACCEVLDRAAYVLDLLRKAKARPPRIPRMSPEPEGVGR